MLSPQSLFSFAFFASLVSVVACSSPNVGGGCVYTDVPGTLTIVSVSAPRANESACSNGGVIVHTQFTPDNPSLVPAEFASEAPFPSLLDVAGGEGPPSVCLTPLGIVAGAKVPGVGRFETHGTCDPFITQPAAGLGTCEADCFATAR